MSRPLVPRLFASLALAGLVSAAAADERLLGSAAAPPRSAPLELTVDQAVLMALENSPELAVERLRPSVERTIEGEEAAIFDPLLIAEDVGWQSVEGEKLRGFGILETFATESPVGRLALRSYLPTGTGFEVEASTEVADESTARQLVQSRVGLTVSQALLRGFGQQANQAAVRAARIGTKISEYELRGFTENFVALVEQTCWDLALYRRQAEILDDAVALAEELLRNIETRVQIGTSARVELAAARSEVAARNQDRIDVRSDAEKTRLLLVRLLNPGGPDAWEREVRLKEDLVVPDATLDEVAEQVAAAVQMRPELNQARLLAERGDLELVRTKNGLLPRMDLFVTLGSSGYADSFSGSWKGLDGDYDDVLAGLRFEFPVRRREARAQHERAEAEKAQADKGVENLRLLVEMDVRLARIEAERARQQIVASSLTREQDEEKLRAEVEKFRIGRASAFQVARAQRDLVRSRLAEAAALAETRKALVELYRLDGTLLWRRGIQAPGQPPSTALGPQGP